MKTIGIIFIFYATLGFAQVPGGALFDLYYKKQIDKILYTKLPVFIEIDLSRAKSKTSIFTVQFSWVGPFRLDKWNDLVAIADEGTVSFGQKQPVRFKGEYPLQGSVTYSGYYPIDNGTRSIAQQTVYPIQKVRLKNMYIFVQGNAVFWYRNCDKKPTKLPKDTEGTHIMGSCN